jgi:hypothetical protein
VAIAARGKWEVGMTSGARVSVSAGDARASGERRWQAGLAVRGEQAGVGRGVGGPDVGKTRGRLGCAFGVGCKRGRRVQAEVRLLGRGRELGWVGVVFLFYFHFPISNTTQT